MRPLFSRFCPTDWIVFAYCALTALLILAFGRPLAEYTNEIAFYLGGAVLPIVLSRHLDERKSRIQAFFRLAYPVILFAAFYSMTQGLIFLFVERFQDAALVSLEQSVFGAELTQLLDRTPPNVIITEVLSCCYFGYYLMIPAFFLPVFIKRDYRIFKEATAAACMAFFFSYWLFSVYPIEGPRWHFAAQYQHEITGPVFREMVNFVISKGAVHGGCMPSTHTAVALVLMFFCFRYYRVWGWVMLPVVAGLAAGTVWGRFHYVSDVIVGAAIGIAAWWVIQRNHSRWTDAGSPATATIEARRTHVS